MVHIRPLLLFAATSHALTPRSEDQVIPDLKKIVADTKNFTAAVKAYKGGPFASFADYFDQLDQDLFVAWDEGIYPHSNPYTQAQANAICKYTNATLVPVTTTFIHAVVAKRKLFVANGLNATVHDDLQKLSDDTDTMISAFLQESPNGYQAACSAADGTLNDEYAAAIAAFSK